MAVHGLIWGVLMTWSVALADPSAAAGPPSTFDGGYHTVAAHEAHLSEVAAEHPDLATVYSIGESWRMANGLGGHPLEAICLTKKRPGDCALSAASAKPKFTIIAQIHAREITTSELAWRWIDYLIAGYATDPAVQTIMDSTESWVIPIANPDGTDIVASGDNSPVSQRKNADDLVGSCRPAEIGVDLNRNSTFHWGGGTDSPCDPSYQGPKAGSEPETQALESFFRSIYSPRSGDPLVTPVPDATRGVMITLHSYGNDIIVPWGWTNRPSPNDAQLRRLASKLAESNRYTVGTNMNTVGYQTPGTTDDFTYGVLGVASFTIEVGPDESAQCGGFFPAYSCVNSTFWPQLSPAFRAAASAASAPYRQ